MDWKSFKTVDEFKAWVEGQGVRFSFKVGIFNDHRERFEGVGSFFHTFFGEAPQTRKDQPIPTPLGLMTHRNLILEPAALFDGIGKKPRQGDIIRHRKDDFGNAEPEPHFWILLSHSCDIENRPFIQLAPGYPFTFIKKEFSTFGVKAESLGNVLENKTIRFLSLPPNDIWTEDAVVFDLSQARAFPTSRATGQAGLISLSMCGNYYLQNRLGILYVRDVRDTDDTRSLNGDRTTQDKLPI